MKAMSNKELLIKITESLAEDRFEAERHGDKLVTKQAEEICKNICLVISDFLKTSSVKWAVFGEDSGDLCLVIRSDDRRADFCISADGCVITIICVDENMKVTKSCLFSLNRRLLLEAVEWVIEDVIEEPEK